MNNSQYFKSFCTGCGLCHSIVGTEIRYTEKGFLVPKSIRIIDTEFMNKICMASGAFWKNNNDEYKVWGKLERKPFYAYSNNPVLRKKASSGGVVSEIAIYLIKNDLVDGIIESKASFESQIKTQVVVNNSVEEILECCGSRYTTSSPLLDIKSLLKKGKRYAFIGKPCDVIAVRNWKSIDADIDYQIPYLISFLCAGVPSKQAEYKLLNALNTSEQDCTDLVYRGNGWPGFTISRSRHGETGRLLYADSWGKILGRDVAYPCRFCYDGIGEAADIACGDGWYIKDGKPDFCEHEGRNIVFVRTKIGNEIIDGMTKTGTITCVLTDNPFQDLIQIQNYQYIRRITMREKLLALRLFKRPIPAYSKIMMKRLGNEASFRTRMRILIGTLKRLYDNRI